MKQILVSFFCLCFFLSAAVTPAQAGETVTIDGVTITANVFGNGPDVSGGWDWSDPGDLLDPNGNTVNFINGSDAAANSKWIVGGFMETDGSVSGNITANNNTVNINGSDAYLVYGGYADADYASGGNAAANGNTVNVTGNSTATYNIYGGEADSRDGTATATGNTVNIENNTGAFNSIYGASVRSDNNLATANSNTVTATNNSDLDVIYAAHLTSSLGSITASGNTVDITGSTLSGYIQGVRAQINDNSSGSVTVNGTTVTITGSTIGDRVWGANIDTNTTTTATNNSVTITGGSVVSGEVGGASINNGNSLSSGVTMNANNNTVTIMDSTVTGDVYGGRTWSESGLDTMTATGNTVTIGGVSSLSGSDFYGGYFGSGTGDAWTGNTLNVKNSGMSVNGVYNFENLNFYLPTDMTDGETMLTVSSAVNITNSKIGVGVDGGTSALNEGDTVILIDTSGNGLNASGVNTTAFGLAGIAKIYDFELDYSDGQNLYATAVAVRANDQLKALSEGRLAGLAFAGQGYDLILGPGMYAAILETKRKGAGLVPFAAVSGDSIRYNTDSHVDVDGVHLMAGLAWRAPAAAASSLVTGAFLEAGWGSYDTRNSFNNLPSVKGKGDTDYYGGGVLGRYEGAAGPGSAYAEASFRAGYANTDFSSRDILNSSGGKTKYDSGSMYYGAHAGAGYVWNITKKASLDLSSKFIWLHMNSDTVTISGDRINFQSADSQRWRTGGQFSYAVNGYVTPYAGAYFDYEFGGKAKGKVNGDKIDTPDIKGATGEGNLGVIFTPAPDLPLSLDLGVQGYVGTREGVTGSLRVKYEF